MMPPPPMPNRPARIPVTTPPATISSTSHASSWKGTPKTIGFSAPASVHLRNVRRYGVTAPSREKSTAGTGLAPPIRLHDSSACDAPSGRDRLAPARADARERFGENRGAGARLDRLARQVPAEGARAPHAAEQPQHVAGDGRKARAARKLALDIGDERHRHVLA